MRIFLAPMEGVVDHTARELLTALGGIDVCVTEFIRVCDSRLPQKVFHRYCPELMNSGIDKSRTQAGTEVRVQLLGGNPDPMAFSAAKAAKLGAAAIDLNFGCPAKSVNKNDGGASLLREPERIHAIVKAVRERVPAETPVTAKIRLGFEDRSLYMDNALAITEAGANELTVHARSKVDGYKPPAYWEYIARIREQVDIPVIANGEIWTLKDFHRCRDITGCDDFMLGRGLMACPDLGRQIHADINGEDYQPLNWSQVCQLVYQLHCDTMHLYPKKFIGNRIKQWLVYLRRQYPEATVLFNQIKQKRDAGSIERVFADYLGNE